MLADQERVEAALAVRDRLRRAGAGIDAISAARHDRWDEWMSPVERHELLSLTAPDAWAVAYVAEAEQLLLEALLRICHEPEIAAALEQHRPRRGEL
jgi:hypothetical protein